MAPDHAGRQVAAKPEFSILSNYCVLARQVLEVSVSTVFVPPNHAGAKPLKPMAG